MIREIRQTITTMIAAFSLLTFSAFAVLWQQSTQDLRIAGGAFLLFQLGLICSPKRKTTVGVAFLFAGVHWLVTGLVSGGTRELMAAATFVAVPAAMLAFSVWKVRRIGEAADSLSKEPLEAV